jgi:hypothetical protein
MFSVGKKRRPEDFPGAFWSAKITGLVCCAFADSVYRTCINTSTTIDAASFVDYPYASRFADCTNRTRIVTCTAVDAFVRNCISQDVHLPLVYLPDIIE